MFESGPEDNVDRINNETVFNTLVGISNNPAIFSKLDEETQKKMISLLVAYAQENVHLIYRSWYMSGLTEKAKHIQEQMEDDKPMGIL